MAKNNKENGLKLIGPVKSDWSSDEKKFSDIKSFDEFIVETFGKEEAQTVLYLDYGIYFARWEKSSLTFYNSTVANISYLRLARIFNADKELKIWREGDRLKYRIRIDGQGKECYFVEARQKLWGTWTEWSSDDWSCLTEKRGTELIIPMNVLMPKGKELPRVFLKARNYIGFLGNQQASYVDCRFVKFEIK